MVAFVDGSSVISVLIVLVAVRFATCVVLETTNGAVPVETVEVNCPDTLNDVPVAAPILGVISVGVFASTGAPVPV